MNRDSILPLQMGRIGFINVLPVHLHLPPKPGLYTEHADVPSHLNAMIRAGKLDISAVSCVEYALNADQYLILPGLSISANNAVQSVLLLSEEPMVAWPGRAVEAPFESDTSVMLVRLLLKKLWKLDCTVLPEGHTRRPAAVLRIGDRALQEADSGRWPFVWDLGKAWRQWTGLPFVFGLWVVTRRAAEHHAEVAEMHRMLVESRLAGMADLDGCAHTASLILGGPEERYRQYFSHLDYDLNDEHQKGLKRFFAMAAEAGLLPAAPRLAFFPQTP